MRILLTAHDYTRLRGLQVFCLMLGSALQRRGHDVAVYSPFVGGELAAKTIDAGVSLSSNLRDAGRPDVVIVNGSFATACEARRHWPLVTMVFVYHASAGMPNRPPVDLRIARHLAVSEEVRDRSASEDVPARDIGIFRSVVDTDRFRPATPVRRRPTDALVFSAKFTSSQVDVMRRACEASGVSLTAVARGTPTVFAVEDLMNRADLVITRGRGAIEAMACGRVVVVPGDGIVTAGNVDELQARHFSGRRFRAPLTEAWLRAEIDRFDPKQGADNRALVEDRYSARRQAERLESVLERVVRTDVPPLLHKEMRTLGELADSLDASRRQARSVDDAIRRQETLVNVHRSRHWRLLRRLVDVRNRLDLVVTSDRWVRFNQRVVPLDSRSRKLARSVRSTLWKLLSQ